MSEKQMFHFFIGPVHEFVASARRTRDFQAGSLLLSWLSAVGAMAATHQVGTANLFPQLDEKLTWALKNGGAAMASMPNRFSVEVEDGFEASMVEQAVRKAWQALAEKVWATDVQPLLTDENRVRVESVWQRQVDAFWEIYWVVAPVDAPFAMDWRKNWRTPAMVIEPGAKCSQMPGLQELSGIEGMGREDNAVRREFWAKLGRHLKNDLQAQEQLSAIALIKRRMYRYFADLKVEVARGLTLHGLQVARPVPSTPFLAAYPALEKLVQALEASAELTAELKALEALYLQAGGGHGEYDCWVDGRSVSKALVLDGQAWFEKTYDNPKGYGLKQDKERLKKAQACVRKMWRAVGVTPSPFYALLSMDGDGLGKQMGNKAKRPFISRGLGLFTEQVPEIVKAHQGHLIYAGGDDVLALLPVPGALKCAAALRSAYLQAFEQVNQALPANEKVETTLSGAVLFAHYDRPLSRMLERVFELMESVSKDTTGRDAITIEVLKPSGRHLLWTQPWCHALSEGENSLVVESLADRWRQDEEAGHKFFYRLIDYLDRLAPELRFARDMSRQESLQGACRESFVNELVGKVWAVAFVQSGLNIRVSIKEAEQALRELVEQCRPVRRDAEGQLVSEQCEVVRPDGALLVKFLMQYGEAE